MNKLKTNKQTYRRNVKADGQRIEKINIQTNEKSQKSETQESVSHSRLKSQESVSHSETQELRISQSFRDSWVKNQSALSLTLWLLTSESRQSSSGCPVRRCACVVLSTVTFFLDWERLQRIWMYVEWRNLGYEVLLSKYVVALIGWTEVMIWFCC